MSDERPVVPRYMLHPINVSVRHLVELYRVPISECVVCASCNGRKMLRCEEGKLIDLFPNKSYTMRADGKQRAALREVMRIQDEADTELIECNRCEACLNGVSFWIMDGGAEVLCEGCYALDSVNSEER